MVRRHYVNNYFYRHIQPEGLLVFTYQTG